MCLYSLSTKESRSDASVCRCSFLVPANDRLTVKKKREKQLLLALSGIHGMCTICYQTLAATAGDKKHCFYRF